MITNRQLGTWGRLGNNIWQYAWLLSLQQKRGFDIGIPGGTVLYDNLFKLKRCKIISDFTITKQDIFYTSNDFIPELWTNAKDWTDYNGYYQNFHYIDFMQDIIKDEFTFKINLPTNDYVGVHIRRGDYVTNGLYVLPTEYYLEAMDLMKGEKFLFFSDDMDWVRENYKGENIFYNDIAEPYQDLIKLSACKHHISSNSTLSWWAAFLSKGNGTTIVNRKWFGSDPGNGYTFPDNWIKIENF